jgi:hypothetical protein
MKMLMGFVLGVSMAFLAVVSLYFGLPLWMISLSAVCFVAFTSLMDYCLEERSFKKVAR